MRSSTTTGSKPFCASCSYCSSHSTATTYTAFSAFGAHSDVSTTNSTSPALPDGPPSASGTGKGALYDIFALTEGSLWSLCLLFSLGGLWRVYRYQGHAIHARREQPVTAKTRHKKGRASALTEAM